MASSSTNEEVAQAGACSLLSGGVDSESVVVVRQEQGGRLGVWAQQPAGSSSAQTWSQVHIPNLGLQPWFVRLRAPSMPPSLNALSWDLSWGQLGWVGDGGLCVWKRWDVGLCQHNRGTCRQARSWKQAVSQGEELLPGFREVVSGWWNSGYIHQSKIQGGWWQLRLGKPGCVCAPSKDWSVAWRSLTLPVWFSITDATI